MNLQSKIITDSILDSLVNKIKSEGKKIAFTNGCFDILHPGHVIYLEEAAKKADVLILGMNSDDSVRRQGKSPERPINNFDARSTVIAGLASIDLVIEFDEDTPLNLIKRILPDVLIKGGDYDPNQNDPTQGSYIVGKQEVENAGGIVSAIPFVEGYSTTSLIEKLKS